MKRRLIFAFAALWLLSGSILFADAPLPGPLDWRTFRYDAGRSGRAQGVGEILQPAVKWSYFAGSRFSPGVAWIGDASGNGANEAVVVVAGRAVAKNAFDETLWITENHGLENVIGSWDFNGDGVPEVLATRASPPAALVILNGKGGQTLWKFAGFDPKAGSLDQTAVKVADLDGDGLPDIVAKPSIFYPHVHAFGFAEGFQADPLENELWKAELTRYYNSTPLLVGDVDGSQEVEVVLLEYRQVTVLDGATGAHKHVSDDIFDTYLFGHLELAEVDGDPALEIVSIGTNYRNYAVSVYDVETADVLWQFQWVPAADKGLAATNGSLCDLTGDGRPEILVSVYNDTDDEITVYGTDPADHDGVNRPDQWTLLVFDAATGNVLDTEDHAYLRLSADLDGDGRCEVVVQDTEEDGRAIPPFGRLRVLAFHEGRLEPRWSLDDAAVPAYFTYESAAKNTRNSLTSAPVSVFEEGRPPELLLFLDADRDGRPDLLKRYDASGSEPLTRAEWVVPEGADPQLVALNANLGAEGLILFHTSDGVIQVRTRHFEPYGRLRAGRYVGEALAFDAENDGRMDILLQGSDNSLRKLDLSDATVGRPPGVSWSYKGDAAPFHISADRDGDGARETPVRDLTDPANPKVHLLDASGGVLWTAVFSGYEASPQQAAFGDFNGDLVLDLAVVIEDRRVEDGGGNLRLAALDGRDGSELWNVPMELSQTLDRLDIALFVLNGAGDDTDDILTVDRLGWERYDGADGALLFAASGLHFPPQALLADFDEDDVPELLTVNDGETFGIKLFELDAVDPVWTLPHAYQGEVGRRHVGLFGTANGLGFVKATSSGSLEAYGPNGLPVWDAPVYPSAGSLQTEKPEGFQDISGVTVADIDNDGNEDLLFGTSDGLLMAVRLGANGPETLWSFSLDYPVSTPLAADLDGDGLLEILAFTDNGMLHLIDQAGLAAPADVRETALSADLAILNPETDVDEGERLDAIGAAWDAVPDADGYYGMIQDENGNPITDWQDLGSGTQGLLHATLLIDRTYHVRVKAHDAEGEMGEETRSDGILLRDASPPAVLSFDAVPRVFNPALSTVTLQGEAEDASGIRRFVLEAKNEDGETAWTLERNHYAARLYLSRTWDGNGSGGGTLPEGRYGLSLTVEDLGGHVDSSEVVHVNLDRTAPPPPEIDAPGEGALLSDYRPLFEGRAEAESRVTIRETGTLAEICGGQSDAGGAFSCRPDSDLSPGEWTVEAVARDAAGNRSLASDPRHFRIGGASDGDADSPDEDTETPDGDTDSSDEDVETPDGDGTPDGDDRIDGDWTWPADGDDTPDGDASGGGGGGCHSTGPGAAGWLLAGWLFLLLRRRNARDSRSGL